MFINQVPRIIIGIILILIGLIGLLVPIMPGWLFIIPGFVLINPEKGKVLAFKIKSKVKSFSTYFN